ncbi:MAG: hypothetical protein IPK75_01465 [Acidobacteria bacterium]|nr:hypothetical protein [Acidobacteriota bacterium]
MGQGSLILQADPLREILPLDLEGKGTRARLIRRLSQGWYDVSPQVQAVFDAAAAEANRPRFGDIGPPVHDFNAARGYMRALLPGWWFRLGQCHLSTDIALAPDYNDPAHGARLRALYPESFWDGGLDFDIRPAISDAAALCLGLLAVLERISDIDTAVKQGRLEWPKD